jgi:outer membrane protein assembly factor BamB
MKKVAGLLLAIACSAADWTCAGGEQKHEKLLSVQSVGRLQLVVKRKLGNQPLGPPVMLGSLVTNKGIKDLVFIAGGDTVYAVDSDLGTLFWERRLPTQNALTPVLERRNDETDDDDYLATDVRALFLLQAGGRTIALNAGSGTNLATREQAPACKPRKVEAAVTNGVRFELTNRHGKAVLRAIDTKNGHELYNSGDRIEGPVDSSGLAIANGHVCFGDTAGTLYCFGFPVDL